jgi:hypothetical protein
MDFMSRESHTVFSLSPAPLQYTLASTSEYEVLICTLLWLIALSHTPTPHAQYPLSPETG